MKNQKSNNTIIQAVNKQGLKVIVTYKHNYNIDYAIGYIIDTTTAAIEVLQTNNKSKLIQRNNIKAIDYSN